MSDHKAAHGAKRSKAAGRVHQISAVSNPRIKSLRALAQKKNRDVSGSFLVEGMKLVWDAFENGWEIETLVYSTRFAEENQNLQEFAAQVRTKGGDILEVSDKILTSITRRDNAQMVLGVMRQVWHDAPRKVSDKTSVWLGLDRVRDPGNLGTIIRTADSAGCDGIILIGETTDPYSLEAARASMGSIFNVPLVRLSETDFLNWRKSWSGKVLGTHLMGAVDYRIPDYHGDPVLLLMGNEQRGLPENLAEVCDQLIKIPMAGSADSLNLAIATGVMLFHMGKRFPPPAFSTRDGETGQ